MILDQGFLQAPGQLPGSDPPVARRRGRLGAEEIGPATHGLHGISIRRGAAARHGAATA